MTKQLMMKNHKHVFKIFIKSLKKLPSLISIRFLNTDYGSTKHNITDIFTFLGRGKRKKKTWILAASEKGTVIRNKETPLAFYLILSLGNRWFKEKVNIFSVIIT